LRIRRHRWARNTSRQRRESYRASISSTRGMDRTFWNPLIIQVMVGVIFTWLRLCIQTTPTNRGLHKSTTLPWWTRRNPNRTLPFMDFQTPPNIWIAGAESVKRSQITLSTGSIILRKKG
jgi:hypothetical protein